MSRRRIERTSAAKEDLKSIWGFTVDRWGESQAERYMQDIERILETLATFPQSAPHLHQSSALRVSTAGEHRILYVATGDGIRVARILHQVRDFTREIDRTFGRPSQAAPLHNPEPPEQDR